MKLGMILFLISEAFLFGALFTVYFYLRAETAVWPPAGVKPDITLAVINTIILLASSAVMQWAVFAIKKDNKRGLTFSLALTAILGLAFLGITFYEWGHEPFTPSSSAYGSIFFTMTGFHALHIFGGLLIMAALLIRNLKNKFSSGKYLAVEVGSLYWHYVDFIWLLVFTTLFIIR
jgi:cytochrome c oxidase subunit 3